MVERLTFIHEKANLSMKMKRNGGCWWLGVRFSACWPLLFTHLFGFLRGRRQALLHGMLKDTEQRTEETGKIIQIAAGVMWEVLNWGPRESSEEHPGSGCILVSAEVKRSFSKPAGHRSPESQCKFDWLHLFHFFKLNFTLSPIYLVFGLEKIIPCYSCISGTAGEAKHEDQRN